MIRLIRSIICPGQTQKSYLFNHTTSNTFQPKTANARMLTRIKRKIITALYFYTSHLIKKCQHCPYILTFFHRIISYIHCSSLFKNPNISSFTNFILKALYVTYFHITTCMWSFEISILYNCVFLFIFVNSLLMAILVGWNMLLNVW
jgi:hypothetical protein